MWTSGIFQPEPLCVRAVVARKCAVSGGIQPVWSEVRQSATALNNGCPAACLRYAIARRPEGIPWVGLPRSSSLDFVTPGE
jgi:hypothetical protein